MIKTENLTYRYEDNTLALNNVNIDIDVGNVIGILGANGSGKSTLFLNLVGILKPTKGKVYFDNKEMKYDKKSLLKLRKSLGIVFQDPDKQIFYSKVYDDIAFGPRNMGIDKEGVATRVSNALISVGAEGFKDKPVHFLSYGQKKRVSIAGILAMDNDVILFDEPTAGLDPNMTESVINILKDISDKGKKVIISSHDMDLIYSLCDYAYILDNGNIIAEDKIENIFLKEDILQQAKLKEPWLVKLHKNMGIPLFRIEQDLYEYWRNNVENSSDRCKP